LFISQLHRATMAVGDQVVQSGPESRGAHLQAKPLHAGVDLAAARIEHGAERRCTAAVGGERRLGAISGQGSSSAS
jgi:hypothetical protein